MAEPDFRIWVIPPTQPKGPAQVILRTTSEETPLTIVMYATSYMMHLAAQGNPNGYEKTMELLMDGAMNWRNMGVAEEPKEEPSG